METDARTTIKYKSVAHNEEITVSPNLYSEIPSKNSGEVTHIEFLKVHKAASSTVQNIFIRFGLKRNLSFVIPADQHYISKEKTYFSDIWPPLPKMSRDTPDKSLSNQGQGEGYKHDILCNHMVFNRKKISRLLHNDSVYIGIVREPLDQFLSSAVYYKFKWRYPYLDRLPIKSFITDLIRNPVRKEATTMAESMTYNSMSYDFGMGLGFSKIAINNSLEKFDEFLNDTANTFHLVMLFEMFDESLVLLKRYLNFTLKDVIYVRSNGFSLKKEMNFTLNINITEDDMATFRKRNQFDIKLYAFFKARIEKQIAKEKNFQQEVDHFKKIVHDVQEFCVEEDSANNETTPLNEKAIKKKAPKKEKGPKDFKLERLNTLLKTINSTLNNKLMSEKQRTELGEFENMLKKDYLQWPLNDLIRLIPMLFLDNNKDKEEESDESDLVIQESEWNEKFSVKSSDCDLMNMEELTLYREVKVQHVRLTVYRKFGENFSVIEAIKHVLTFY